MMTRCVETLRRIREAGTNPAVPEHCSTQDVDEYAHNSVAAERFWQKPKIEAGMPKTLDPNHHHDYLDQRYLLMALAIG